jgi:hypothetical protein
MIALSERAKVRPASIGNKLGLSIWLNTLLAARKIQMIETRKSGATLMTPLFGGNPCPLRWKRTIDSSGLRKALRARRSGCSQI